MRRIHALLTAVALAGLALGTSCTRRRAHTPENATPSASAAGFAATTDPGATVLRRSAQCGSAPLNGEVRWIGTDAEYRAALDAIDRGTLPGTAPAPVPVDFASHGVVLVLMGQRPTAGYALDLASEEVPVEDGTGTVRVNWNEPPEDATVAQVVTSPCLLVAVRRDGLRAVKVVDQAGRARETLQLQ